MNEKKEPDQTPQEIPTRKDPDQTDPLKDPNLPPNEKNPINPKVGELNNR